jgi:hypothetical protein
MSTPAFEARLVRGAGLRDELEIVYDGTAPPAALFEDLRAVGWVPPVPAPPPATAIDWTRPDPRTGARYSVRSFEAVGRAVPGPGAQGRDAVERLVARHLAEPSPVATPPAPIASAPAPALPRALVSSPIPPRATEAAAASASATPPPAAASPAPLAPPASAAPREREVQVGATVAEERAPAVRDELTGRGLAVRSTRMSLTAPGGYRGATAGQVESAVRLQFRAPLSQIDEIVAILGPEATDVVVRR